MLRILSFAILLLAMPGITSAATVEEASSEIRAAWEKHSSMKATLRIEAAPPIGDARIVMGGDGTVQALRVDGVEKYKSQARLSIQGPMTASMQIESVYDGTTLHVSNDTLGRRGSRTAEPGVYRGAVPPGGGLLMDALAAETNLEIMPEEEVDGIPAYVFEGRAKRGEDKPGPVARLRAYIAKETGALLKLELYETDAVLTVLITQRDFEWDIELDAALFAPAPSEDSLAPLQN